MVSFAGMRGPFVVAASLLLSCSGTVLSPREGAGGSRSGTDKAAGCTKDTDCKGDRICSMGECVSPTDAGQGARGSGGTLGMGGASIFGAGGGGAGSGAGGIQIVCGGQDFGVDPAPVDMYLMFDQSSSMSAPLPGSNPPMSWWQAAQLAVANFVSNPLAGGSSTRHPAMSVGIQFFPLGGISPQSCKADYETPEVELGLLPGNAAAVAAAIQKHQPTSFTPTAAALNGAIAHMKEWAPNHPGHAPVVVLVTDGFPTECDPQDITDIAQIAATAFTTEPRVRTLVVGFNLGPGGANLNELAAAGGTQQAFLIDGGDVVSQFVDAMLTLSGAQPQCEFVLPLPPAGLTLDPSAVALTYTPDATKVEVQIPKLNGPADCTLNMNNGWFYDSPTNPTKIELCPGTCAKSSAGIIKTATLCTPLIGNTQ